MLQLRVCCAAVAAAVVTAARGHGSHVKLSFTTEVEPKSGSEKLRRGDLERTASVRRVRLPPPRRRLA